MIFLKQSTASQTVLIGPFVDSTDGVTAETALTISNTDIRLSKNGANIVAKNSGGGTHDENGYYQITLDATDTNTVGSLQLHVNETGALPVYHEFHVLEEDIYDALIGASAAAFDSNMRVDVGEWLGNAVTASSGNPDVNVESIDGGLTIATVTNLTNLPTIPANWITAAGINANAFTAAKFAASSLNGKGDWNTTTPPTAASIADAVLDEDMTGHQTAGTLGGAIGDPGASTESIYDAVITDAAGTNIAVDIADVPTLAEFNARTLVASSYFDPATDTVANVGTVATLTGHTPQTGDSFARLGAPAGASVSADIATIEGRIPAALVSGRMDSDVQAINSSTTAAVQLALSANEIENGACEGTPTTTVIQTNLAESQDDIYIGRTVIFTSGNARGEATDITDYTGATGTLTVTALANAPAASDTFILI